MPDKKGHEMNEEGNNERSIDESNERKTDNAPTFKLALRATILFALLVLLTLRVVARLPAQQETPATSIAPAAVVASRPGATDVPEPRALRVGELVAPPCWSCRREENRPLRFEVDLDLLAPLGQGSENMAEWLKDFAESGARHGEAEAFLVETDLNGRTVEILPADDPLLLEAEVWMDQATCSFYPEVWEFDGAATPIPDLLFTLLLSRSWIARGHELEGGLEDGREEYRRVVRMGRLLLQDDFTLIQNLVGIANIRLGAHELYEAARRDGDTEGMLVASRALADADSIRLLYNRRMTLVSDVWDAMRRGLQNRGLVRLVESVPALRNRFLGNTIPDSQVERLVAMAKTDPERGFRWEAMYSLYLLKHLGNRSQRDLAQATLTELRQDPDEMIVDMVQWFEDRPLDEEVLEAMGR